MSNASCLLLLVLGVLAASVAAHPRKHDPCHYKDHRGWTWAAGIGEELDEEAMKKLPQAYVQYGWRHYRSGKCSYKGWEQHCPDYYHQKHGGHHFDEHWWDTHFNEPKCNGAHCIVDENCCSHNCNDGFCCAEGLAAITEDCKKDSQCCSGKCTVNDLSAQTAGDCCIPTGSAIMCASTATKAGSTEATAKCCDNALCSTTTLTCCKIKSPCTNNEDCCGRPCDTGFGGCVLVGPF